MSIWLPKRKKGKGLTDIYYADYPIKIFRYWILYEFEIFNYNFSYTNIAEIAENLNYQKHNTKR